MPAVPLEPIVYEHAAALVNLSPWEASRDAAKLAAGHVAAAKRYAMRRVVVGIDLYNVEAEALGATVDPCAGATVPIITTHPCANVRAAAALGTVDVATDGRLAMMLDAARRVAEACPGVRVSVPVAGPWSVACGLMGMQALICEAYDDAAAVGRLLDELGLKLRPWLDAVAASPCSVTVFESGSAPPMLSPQLFRQVVRPVLAAWLTALVKANGERPMLVIGGDTALMIDDLLDLSVSDLVAPGETDQHAWAQRLRDRAATGESLPRVRFNMRADVFSSGDADVVSAERDRLDRIAGDIPGATIGTGVIMYDADPDFVQSMLQ